MDEADARSWLAARHVPRGTLDCLERLVELVTAESEHQNLIARSTLPMIWQRHVVDSAQLLDVCGHATRWADIGTGAGFPGLVVALLGSGRVDCIEPRALRAQFLERLVDRLALGDRVAILAAKVESVRPALSYDVISARAVAPLAELFRAAHHLASPATTWLLPKGRSAALELAEARRTWHGEFRLVPSITDPAAAIVVARDVRPRTSR